MDDAWIDHDYMAYPTIRSQVINWLNSDKQEVYNNPANRKLLKRWDWLNKKVEYTINYYGFRSDEFTAEPNQSILFLGCSYTAGIGLPIEQTWAYQVATHLGLAMYNLGIGGGSCNSCYRIGSHWIPKLKPRHVFVLYPFAHRLEVVKNKGLFYSFSIADNTDSFYNSWIKYDLNSELNLRCTQDALKYICEVNGATYNSMTADEWILGAHALRLPLARDLLHPGIEHNRNRALDIIKLYT
jgi:hypothetical protein